MEYYPERVAVSFLRQAISRVKPGGVHVWQHAADSSPLEFNRRVVAWPGLFPRSIADMTRVAERCGVAREEIKVYLAEDGVYAVYIWRKPETHRE